MPRTEKRLVYAIMKKLLQRVHNNFHSVSKKIGDRPLLNETLIAG